MPTLEDNIQIIQTSIYGKEMRPAISEALTQSWNNVKSMMSEVDRLNARIDALPYPGGGSGVDPDKPDSQIDGSVYIFKVNFVADGIISYYSHIGDATLI